MDAISLIGTIISIAGAFMVARKKVLLANYIWLVSNGLLLFYMVNIGSYDLSIMYAVFLCLAIYAIYEWRPRKKHRGFNTLQDLEEAYYRY